MQRVTALSIPVLGTNRGAWTQEKPPGPGVPGNHGIEVPKFFVLR